MFANLKRLAWFLLPALGLVAITHYVFASYQQPLSNWLAAHPWLAPLGLGVSALIALQFSRSRFVYCCLLLLLYVPSVSQWLPMSADFERQRLYFFALLLSVLLFSRDLGFGLVNLVKTLVLIGLVAVISTFALPLLTQFIQPEVIALKQQLLGASALAIAPQDYVPALVVLSLLVANSIRVLFRPDNTHLALLITFVLCALMYWQNNPSWQQIVLGFIALFMSFCIIKDSFTMAFKDELTTIPSRRALMQYVQTLGRHYAVAMCDIDHFKKFNDTHGHDVGDDVLKLVASKLNKVSGSGKAFRFGGEEFVIVFANKTSQQAEPFIDMVRRSIQDYDIALRAIPRPAKPPKHRGAKPAKNKIVKVTSSFGIAHKTKELQNFEQVMKQADVALYAAKKAGRNCIKLANQA